MSAALHSERPYRADGRPLSDLDRFHKCDQCDRTDLVVYEHYTRRPSDPSDLCCIMALCENCGGAPVPITPDNIPYHGRYELVASWVEEHGLSHGILFIT